MPRPERVYRRLGKRLAQADGPVKHLSGAVCHFEIASEADQSGSELDSGLRRDGGGVRGAGPSRTHGDSELHRAAATGMLLSMWTAEQRLVNSATSRKCRRRAGAASASLLDCQAARAVQFSESLRGLLYGSFSCLQYPTTPRPGLCCFSYVVLKQFVKIMLLITLIARTYEVIKKMSARYDRARQFDGMCP